MRSKVEKRAVALKLKEEALKRTPEEQIRRLDKKLGKGQGARRERARLSEKINERKRISKE